MKSHQNFSLGFLACEASLYSDNKDDSFEVAYIF